MTKRKMNISAIRLILEKMPYSAQKLKTENNLSYAELDSEAETVMCRACFDWLHR